MYLIRENEEFHKDRDWQDLHSRYFALNNADRNNVILNLHLKMNLKNWNIIVFYISALSRSVILACPILSSYITWSMHTECGVVW